MTAEKQIRVIGIDLSGPRNTEDTCAVAFEQQQEDLNLLEAIHGADDRQLIELVTKVGVDSKVVVGLDAPLSYNAGGGDRPSDRELRQLVLEKGRHVGVMTPTMTRMVYLTLRGVALTRMLDSLRVQHDVVMVEVHPGASMVLRGALPQDVASFKRDASARARLLDWLGTEGLKGLPPDAASDHFVAACAAALAAWQWSAGKAVWCHRAEPPQHPYDFAC